MEIELEISNEPGIPVEDGLVRRAAESAARLSGRDFSKKGRVAVSLAWIDEAEIRRLNREYRRNDSVTDILSFAEFGSTEDFDRAAGEVFLGEMVLCYNFIKEYAEGKGTADAVSKEIANVVAHGLLHLLGYEHGKEMFSVQDEVVGGIFKD